jgi:hypothetical protein
MANLDPRVAAAIKADYDAQLIEEQKKAAADSAKLLEHAQVSVAVNTRRIALVLILGVIVVIGSLLVDLAISVFFTDPSSAEIFLIVWLACAVLIMIAGLYVIIYGKRLTKL